MEKTLPFIRATANVLKKVLVTVSSLTHSISSHEQVFAAGCTLPASWMNRIRGAVVKPAAGTRLAPVAYASMWPGFTRARKSSISGESISSSWTKLLAQPSGKVQEEKIVDCVRHAILYNKRALNYSVY